MSAAMIPFEFEFEYGDKKYSIHHIELNGERWWPATQVCVALGFTNPHKAVADHVDIDDLTKREVIDSIGRKQKTNFVNESGVYALIFASKLEQAKAFKRWFTSEVLPAIRKYGYYNAALLKCEMLLSPHIRPYLGLFPPEIWTGLDRIYGITRPDPNKRPAFYAGCVMFIYDTFDPDVHAEMRNRVPDPQKSGIKQHQTLNDAGRLCMAKHISRHQGLIDASGDPEQWRTLARQVFSKQLQLPIRDKRRLPTVEQKDGAA